MYYAVLLALGAIILYVGWPRRNLDTAQFPSQVIEQRLDNLEAGMATLEEKMTIIERMLPDYMPSVASAPLSSDGLANYQAIQQDWQNGSSIQELCNRYQILRGEIELILDLMGEGMGSNESRDLYSIHSDGSQ